jgi:hypothetical protein
MKLMSKGDQCGKLNSSLGLVSALRIEKIQRPSQVIYLSSDSGAVYLYEESSTLNIPPIHTGCE